MEAGGVGRRRGKGEGEEGASKGCEGSRVLKEFRFEGQGMKERGMEQGGGVKQLVWHWGALG